MKRKTPAILGGGVECFADASIAPISSIAMPAQFLASRYAITVELAATVLAIAFGGAPHG